MFWIQLPYLLRRHKKQLSCINLSTAPSRGSYSVVWAFAGTSSRNSWVTLAGESAAEGVVVGVLEREEWWGCCRGRSGGGAAEGGVVRVLDREKWRKCWRGRSAGSAGEGGVLGVLQRRGW